MVKKKVEFEGGYIQSLTKTEQEILKLLTNDFLTIKQIAAIRQKSIQGVYKIVKKLKQKGAISRGLKKVENFQGTIQPLNQNDIRLHGEQWVLNLIHQADNYKKLVGTQTIIDGNTVNLHRDSIVIYSVQSFVGNDTYAATAKSIDYWNRFFAKIENNFNVVVIKPRYTNIHRVKAEYAQMNNGLARECIEKGDKIRIRSREDGKIWFEIDNSFNFKEAETKHPQTAQMDMQNTIAPFFNDVRDNRPNIYLPSENSKVINEILKLIHTVVQSQSVQVSSNQALIGNIQGMAEIMKSQMPKIERHTKLKSRLDYVG